MATRRRVGKAETDEASVIIYKRGEQKVVAIQRHDGWTPNRRALFLQALADTCNVTMACHAAGMSSGAIYPLRKRDPAFRAQWTDALREGYSRLEAALLDRAINGIERPVMYGGKQVASVQHYSDAWGMKMLAHHRVVAASTDPGSISPDVAAEARAKIEARIAMIHRKQARAAEIAASGMEAVDG